ncbi:hypothetical protein [Zobellia galactanivorans]|uniref:Ribbon-helix-helix fold protein n=1 Tax=Zobellia galactanivorans (strain DSM 12802 / CCUG 47099 / CIP 106680 / NCIMB 13871 / Dsij) TaxID=63186 RepID=G0LCD6_ZOBGA|nr:hypothetical protein [Zobellia galactanivorans]CAZ96853.1 Ribbon-helix-helix fold protein [Zobellia galactanivorans]
MAKSEFDSLIAQARASQPKKTIQKIVPEKVQSNNEKQFSFYIDKTILKQLKSRAIEDDKSLKAIINESILNYLNKSR